jgi:hypothetical protein
MAINITLDTDTIPGTIIVTFMGAGSTEWTLPSNSIITRLLVVGAGGGGGGSGNNSTGGGGGGDVKHIENPVISGTIPVTIGAGGQGGKMSDGRPAYEGWDGGASSFGDVTSNGGNRSCHGGNFGEYGISGNGYIGGTATVKSPWLGGGGGGAGSPGRNYNGSPVGGGGDGISSDISGSVKWYGGGGGAGKFSTGTAGVGGSGVGGNGGKDGVVATNGEENTGSGGGGSGYSSARAGSGADGIIILQYIEQSLILCRTIQMIKLA